VIRRTRLSQKTEQSFERNAIFDFRHTAEQRCRYSGCQVASVAAEPLGNNGHGEIYVLRFPLQTQKGIATVLTAWIVRDGEDFRG
jgi:hypothetical protein